jgi:rSAM/selenodomain-associated transferase 2
MTPSPPELTIIIPVLNDAAELRGLLDSLAEQRNICFEVVICDGGSTDDLQNLTASWTTQSGFALRVLRSARGRGTQMNAGAAAAAGHTLLFLHADSRFPESCALYSGLQAYRSYLQGISIPCAARFRLRFRRSTTNPSLAYFFHEAKARLNRGNCIRGDQGILIDHTTFNQLGRFDCSFPFLEDVRLASQMAEAGLWLLLPADISTSARRFELEGFYERQVANVIIVNAIATGWHELLAALPELYRCNSTSGRLSLFPLMAGVRAMIASHDRKWRSTFWQATGSHVAANAWQIFFWLDVQRAFLSGPGADEVDTRWLDLYDQRLKPLFESRQAGRLAEILTRLWLRWMLYCTRKTAS